MTVSGSWTQPGTVRLLLRHLPYDWRGCFGRDWTHARTTEGAGPSVTTHGDGTYRVPTASVPSDGCWTVVPVLTLGRAHRISVTDTAPVDPMTAFTGLRPATAPVARQVGLAASEGTEQVIDAGAGMIVLLVLALGATLSMALRDR